jgi:hypothetical protein
MAEEIKQGIMNWGNWIIVVFVLFAGFIATLVTVCMREDVSLVSKDYYQEELAYQDQMLRVNNANQLAGKPVIERNGDLLEIYFDEFDKIEKGTLKLFRPSDPKMDKTFVLESTKENKLSFSVNELEKGMYRARMQWLMGDKEYFVETIVNI